MLEELDGSGNVLARYVQGSIIDEPLSDGSEALVLMAEFAALRTILLNVLFKQANDETLTAEQMQALIDRADANKLKKAAEWLRQGSKWAGG